MPTGPGVLVSWCVCKTDDATVAKVLLFLRSERLAFCVKFDEIALAATKRERVDTALVLPSTLFEELSSVSAGSVEIFAVAFWFSVKRRFVVVLRANEPKSLRDSA